MDIRKKPRQKNLRLSDEDFELAQRIREKEGLTDADIFSVGLDAFKPDPKNPLHTMYKFNKKAKDDLVSEEYQGNASVETLSYRARMYFAISDAEWALLSEEEKDGYKRRLPGQKTRSGGEEMSNRDIASDLATQYEDFQSDSRDFVKDEMLRETERMEKRNKEYRDAGKARK